MEEIIIVLSDGEIHSSVEKVSKIPLGRDMLFYDENPNIPEDRKIYFPIASCEIVKIILDFSNGEIDKTILKEMLSGKELSRKIVFQLDYLGCTELIKECISIIRELYSLEKLPSNYFD